MTTHESSQIDRLLERVTDFIDGDGSKDNLGAKTRLALIEQKLDDQRSLSDKRLLLWTSLFCGIGASVALALADILKH